MINILFLDMILVIAINATTILKGKLTNMKEIT